MLGKPLKKNNKAIAEEWNALAEIRAKQLYHHNDVSMDYVLKPLIFKMASNANFSNVIDLGCGTGYLTRALAQKSDYVTGIDLSETSIAIAKRYNEDISNVVFKSVAIEDYSSKYQQQFSLAVANMTLMDVVSLEAVIKSVREILQENSYLVITITHPYFWPLYWNYAHKEWFNYKEEIAVEGNFNISLNNTTYKTTHIHRPLEMYINLLCSNGFTVEKLYEPIPQQEIMKKYPKKWEYPRFLGIKCKKQ